MANRNVFKLCMVLEHVSEKCQPPMHNALKSLIDHLTPSQLKNPITEHCHQIEIVAQLCPVLASYLNPIIKRHSTPKDAYKQAKDIDPEDDLMDANELYTMDATDLWPDTNVRPEWATGLDEVCIHSLHHPITPRIVLYKDLISILKPMTIKDSVQT